MSNENKPKCWYCQEEIFQMQSGKSQKALFRFRGRYWHAICLGGYLRVRQFLANKKEVQNPLSDRLLTTRKPIGLTKYARSKIRT